MKQVYFDMDGVLDDFDKYGRRHFPDLLREPMDQNVFWDTIEARCGTQFWILLEPIVQGLKLLEQVRSLDNTHVTLLTALPDYNGSNPKIREDAIQGKLDWVAKYIGYNIPIIMCRRPEKVNYVNGRNTILIDDYEKTTKEWANAGGTAILFDKTQTAEHLRIVKG
jgi:hypothetical protein